MSPPRAGLHADWGVRPYREMHAIQERLVVARADGRLPNLLLTGEHPAVVTLGRKTPGGFVGASGTDVVVVERGGEATYHGAWPRAEVGDRRPEGRKVHQGRADAERRRV